MGRRYHGRDDAKRAGLPPEGRLPGAMDPQSAPPPMAVGSSTWNVRPHSPIEVLAPNLWRVEGVMSAQNRRVVVLVRLGEAAARL